MDPKSSALFQTQQEVSCSLSSSCQLSFHCTENAFTSVALGRLSFLMRKEYSQDTSYFSLPTQPRTPKFCIYLRVYSSVHNQCPCWSYHCEGLHSASDCTGLDTGLQGQMGDSSSCTGSVTSHVPHLLFMERDREDQDKEGVRSPLPRVLWDW